MISKSANIRMHIFESVAKPFIIVACSLCLHCVPCKCRSAQMFVDSNNSPKMVVLQQSNISKMNQIKEDSIENLPNRAIFQNTKSGQQVCVREREIDRDRHGRLIVSLDFWSISSEMILVMIFD